MSGSERMQELDRDAVGMCAFLAAYLEGMRVDYLAERGRQRSFEVIWLGQQHSCIWDALRFSFVHVEGPGGWHLYDFISGHHLRCDRADGQFTFADQVNPTWSVRVRVTLGEAHASGPDGEHCFQLGRAAQAGREVDTAPRPVAAGLTR